jgi:hypothetical protein
VEQGSHAELMARGGEYHKLYTTQYHEEPIFPPGSSSPALS